MLLNVLKRIASARRPPAVDLLAQGVQAQSVGDLESAELAFRALLRREPHHVDAAHLLGVLLQRTERAAEAIAWLQQAVRGNDAEPASHLHLGSALQALGRLQDAEAEFREAVRLAPHLLSAHVSLGILCKQLGRLDEARQAIGRALALNSGSAEVWHNLGSLQRDLGDELGACASFERALSIDPGMLEAQFSRALSLLAIGDFERGWDAYDVRLRLPRRASDLRPFRAPVWQGEPLPGRGLLVWGEQGIGDEIFHAGMYLDLIAAGARCVFECSAKLAPLFERSFPQATVVVRTEPPHAATTTGIDFQIAAGSLARYLRTALDRFPVQAAYLQASPQRVAHWQRELTRLGPGLKVGFCWRSSDLRGERSLACARLEEWGTLLRIEGVHWISLQYDDCEAELDAARAHGCVLHRFSLDYFNDLDEVSALTRALDLVISAPTAVSVHAAALGVPVWQLNYGADWQVHGTPGNPWYPSLVRYLRHWQEPWSKVLDRVAADLRARVSGAME